jgi:hypothetical protein
MRIRYRINRGGQLLKEVLADSPKYWSIQDGLDPETSLTEPEPAEVTRDEFLATVIMRVRDQEISVKDTILHTANVVGAVHPGKPPPRRRDTAELLEEMAAGLRIGGYRPDIRSLQAIGRVVVSGLIPLRERIQKDSLSAGQGAHSKNL